MFLLIMRSLSKLAGQKIDNLCFVLFRGCRNNAPPDKLKITIVAGLPLPLLKLIDDGEGRWQGDVGR